MFRPKLHTTEVAKALKHFYRNLSHWPKGINLTGISYYYSRIFTTLLIFMRTNCRNISPSTVEIVSDTGVYEVLLIQELLS